MEPSSDHAMDHHVVTVAFEVKQEHVKSFRRAVLDNAHTSLMAEQGCLVFDVCESPDRPAFFLYELYQDRTAFELHLATDHFKAFDAMSADWIVSKAVARFERLCGAGPASPNRGRNT